MIKRCIYCQSRVNVDESVIDCPNCGMTNKLTPFCDTPMLNATTFRVFDSYESPATGKVITNMRERDHDMKASGCREWEGIEQEKKEAARREKYDEEKLGNLIETVAAEEFAKLPEESRQSLL